MILVDSSVWTLHLRTGDPLLAGLLDRAEVLGHVFVRGELACGNLRRRDEILALLADLPQAVVATDDEVLELIERHRLMGRGIGYVDAHLLAATLLTGGALLVDPRSAAGREAKQLGVGAQRPPNSTIRRASAIIATARSTRIVQPREDLPELGQGRAVEGAHRQSSLTWAGPCRPVPVAPFLGLAGTLAKPRLSGSRADERFLLGDSD